MLKGIFGTLRQAHKNSQCNTPTLRRRCTCFETLERRDLLAVDIMWDWKRFHEPLSYAHAFASQDSVSQTRRNVASSRHLAQAKNLPRFLVKMGHHL
jgi:hypothetical protein